MKNICSFQINIKNTSRNICILVKEYEEKDRGKRSRVSSIFKMNFKDEISPILKECKIFDFVGQHKKKAAERLHQFVMENCQSCRGRQD